MKILGITSLIHDTGASLVEDGKITHAVNEERISRKKMHVGFPFQSLDYILKKAKNNIDYAACSDISPSDLFRRIKAAIFDPSLVHSNPYYTAKSMAMMTRWVYKTMRLYKHHQDVANRKLKELGVKTVRLEHHPNHAASAYFTSGMKKALVVTCDNHGDGLCGTVHIGENNQLKLIDALKWPHSPGFFYAIITKVLGFKVGRHEGKITGLAAYGDRNSPVYNKISKLMWYENGTIKTRSMMGLRGYVKSLARKYSREDLSAVFQRILEETVSSYVKYWMDQTGIKNIALAGGVFANVKLNQKILEQGAKEVFIHPHMGDGGTGAGAALHLAMLHGNAKPYYLEDAYLGPSYSDEEIKGEIKKHNLNFEYLDDIESQIAELISKGKVVAYFDGSMEYGPRALGSRSILYHTTDPSVNDWLNKRLKRTEFMPFAPLTLERFAKKCYKHFDGGEHAAKFMTITFDCTDFMKRNSPATVHVDHTARPQTINK
ncbi:MAG: carbamoyltransferase N-terminal domain-containing protein, partial [Nanoarchaeota archaeon]